MTRVYFGQIVHTKSFDEFEIFPNGFLAIDATGKIIGVGDVQEYPRWIEGNCSVDIKDVTLTPDQFLMPGFIDCHIHAPQVAQIGLGLDMPLLDWLNTYTFPLEAKFKDQDFASAVYSKVVQSTIRSGTTCASYFGTNDKDSTLILAQKAKEQGQRALVGKVCSNRNSPDFYVETTEESIKGTKDFVESINKLESTLIKPTITPRFAVSCTKELMKELGKIAHSGKLHIQSHISENTAEIEFVQSLFNKSYAEAYDESGLLTSKTIMAHGVHLEDREIALLKQRGTSIAHCPASNTMLSSGFCDVLRLIKKGLKVGLGTDVSGGNSMSIQHAILRALEVSHHLEFVKKQNIKGTGAMPPHCQDATYVPLNYKQAIYLATLGGAEALNLSDNIGNFAVGKQFDALLIDTSIYPLSKFDIENDEEGKSAEKKLLELVQRFIYVGDDRNIVEVFVRGNQIKL